jgi:deoxyribonuclease-4
MSFLSADLLSFLELVPPAPKQLRVRQVLDGMGGVARNALRRMIPYGDAPALPTERYPSALLSYFPKAYKYACLGIVAEHLLRLPTAEDIHMESLAVATAHTCSVFGLEFDPAGFSKVVASKTTQPFLNVLKTTRYTMDVHIRGALAGESVLKGTHVMGHPDARTTDQIFEIKLTGELEKNWPYFLCQLFAYGSLDPTATDLYLVLPLQAAVIHFDVRAWAKRSAYKERLESAAGALLAPKPAPDYGALTAGSDLLYKYKVGRHMPKRPTLLDTVRALPTGVPNQIFLGAPQNARFNVKDADIVAAATEIARRGLEVYVHAPYILNLAEPPASDDWAVKLLQRNLTVAAALGCKGVVVHVGKSKDRPVAEAVAIMRTALARAASVATPACPLLLETPAGQGTELLTKPEEFIDFVDSFATPTLRACLDTCHVFACGHCPVKYVDAMLAKPGLLKLIHYNDSMDLCGACKDRHAYVGTGKIGLEALTAVAERATSAGIPMVME